MPNKPKDRTYRPLVYICSPLSDDVPGNTERARKFCRFALEKGQIPLAPHLLFPQFMNDADPVERELAIFMDVILLGKCSELWVFGDAVCKSIVWRCVSRVLKKSSGIDCPARTIREEEMHAAVVTAINDAWSQKESILPVLQKNIREVLESDTEERLAAVDTAIREKQAELLDAGKDQGRIGEIGDAIISLREQRQDILTEAAKNTELKERVDDLASFLNEQTEALMEYSETLARRLIEKITIYDEKLTVEFKSGFSIDVDA